MNKQERDAKILELLQQGKTKAEIKRITGHAPDTINRVVNNDYLFYVPRSQKSVPKKNDPRWSCVECLLGVGFGKRIIIKKTRVPETTIRRIKQRTSSHLFSEKRKNIVFGSQIQGTPSRFLADAFQMECRSARVWDNEKHWLNHPAMNMYGYYKDVAKSRAASAASARKQWAKATKTQRMVRAMRFRIWKVLKSGNVKKSASAWQYLGCNYDTLKAHIESQFTDGMTWDNYGTWHVDHKRPCASFDLTDVTQQMECFNYRNLRPMWATENLSKNSVYNGVRHRYARHMPTIIMPTELIGHRTEYVLL